MYSARSEGRGAISGSSIGGLRVELNPEVPNVKLKHVAQILDRQASTFDPLHLSLAQWVASYYQAPLGEVLRAAHPAGTNGKSKPALRWVSQDDLHAFDLPSPHLEILKTISEHRRTVELDELKGGVSRSVTAVDTAMGKSRSD